jgi:membrane protein required for colicin V production
MFAIIKLLEMNYIDIAISIPLVWGLYRGFVRGLIVESASLIALAVGVWGGLMFSDLFSLKVKELLDWDSEFLPIISFAVVFLGIVIGIYVSANLLAKLAKGLALGGIDKILGAAFGALKFALIISVLIFVIEAIGSSYPLLENDLKSKSVLYEPLGKVAPMIIPSLKNIGL